MRRGVWCGEGVGNQGKGAQDAGWVDGGWSPRFAGRLIIRTGVGQRNSGTISMTAATQLGGGPRHGRSEVIGQVPYARTHVSHSAFQ